jgi:hypothetical protein
MAKSKRIRNFLFQGHRYLGLVLGILIAIASPTFPGLKITGEEIKNQRWRFLVVRSPFLDCH